MGDLTREGEDSSAPVSMRKRQKRPQRKHLIKKCLPSPAAFDASTSVALDSQVTAKQGNSHSHFW